MMETSLPAVRRYQPVFLAPLRIGLTYWWRHGRWPDLDTPRTFTELVQQRKLIDRDSRLPLFADKIRAKLFAARVLGEDWIIPTLWTGGDLPPEPCWPLPFVVKSRHGCNQTICVRHTPADWQAIRRRARTWLARRYGVWLDEWAYAQIPTGIIVEPFIGIGPGLPVDYKFYVFGGRVEYVQVHLGRGHRHRWIVMDRDWRRVSACSTDDDPQRPASFARMTVAAETLARGLEFVRVDFYEIAGRPLFGEMTFYPGSGLDPFDPPTLDGEMGAHWLRARAGATA